MAQDWAEGIRANSLLINPAYYCSQTAIVGVLSEPYPNFRLIDLRIAKTAYSGVSLVRNSGQES